MASASSSLDERELHSDHGAPIASLRDRSVGADLRQQVQHLSAVVDTLRRYIADSMQANESGAFISNLSPSVSDADVRAAFSVYGEVRDVRLLRHPSGEVKGSGFIEFRETDALIDAVIDREGVTVHGRPVRVHFSRPKAARRPAAPNLGPWPGTGPRPEHAGRRAPGPGPIRAYWSSEETAPRADQCRRFRPYENLF